MTKLSNNRPVRTCQENPRNASILDAIGSDAMAAAEIANELNKSTCALGIRLLGEECEKTTQPPFCAAETQGQIGQIHDRIKVILIELRNLGTNLSRLHSL